MFIPVSQIYVVMEVKSFKGCNGSITLIGTISTQLDPFLCSFVSPITLSCSGGFICEMYFITDTVGRQSHLYQRYSLKTIDGSRGYYFAT
ncbi:hypothetical protein TNCT_504881 [Trichonephila clavata]|uniref:Uncharacterized protein n=1 Tax=Trichonephila clavata TaxID=2740835 RepID=A0A8X6L083_TRICU|nr:hypothetical protein TNCT_504881 [Trichonephila clavata]